MGSVATDIEDGALNVIKSMAETVAINLTYDELKGWFPEYAEKYRPPPLIPPCKENIKEILGMAQENTVVQPYVKVYPLLKALFKYSNLIDVDGLISEEQANQIDQAQQQQQEAAIQAQQQKQASEVQLAGAQAHEVQAEGDRHVAQGEDYAASAAATAAGAGAPAGAGEQPPPPPRRVTEVRSNGDHGPGRGAGALRL